VRIRDVHLWEDVAQRPRVRDWWSPVHHDDERALPADEVDEELKERVDGKGLIKL